jgi:secretion/DNA translocation related TadE-like protein
MTTSAHRRDEAGLAAPLVVALAGVVLLAAVATAALGRLLVDQRRAAAAADLAALAGATALQHGEDGCAAARRTAAANGADLTGCVPSGQRIEVSAALDSPTLLGRIVQVRVEAAAGPAT